MAPELGDPEAMFAYAMMLAEGQGVDKDHVAAARYFEAAAVHRHALANYNLALLFLRGEGKPENPYRAFMHMQFAAEAGVAVAQVRSRHALCDGHRHGTQRLRGGALDRQSRRGGAS